MEENILTPDQVAQKLQVHPFTVLKFIKQGKLKASKLGRVYRIRESDVLLFLEEQSRPRQPKAAEQKEVPDEAPKKRITIKNTSLKAVSPVSLPLESAMREEAFQELPEENFSTSIPTRQAVPSTVSMPIRSNASTTTTTPSTSSVNSTSTTASQRPKSQGEDQDLFNLDHYILD